jgi:hypothetical protein
MRTEDDENNASPPGTRIYSQNGDSFRVAPLPVMGATYSLGKQLQDYVDLSDTVRYLLMELRCRPRMCFPPQGTVQISLSTDTVVEFWDTYNVLAYTTSHISDAATIVVSTQPQLKPLKRWRDISLMDILISLHCKQENCMQYDVPLFQRFAANRIIVDQKSMCRVFISSMFTFVLSLDPTWTPYLRDLESTTMGMH